MSTSYLNAGFAHIYMLMDKFRAYIQKELIRELLFEFDDDQLIKFHLTKMDNIDKDGIYYEGRTKDGKKIEVRFGANAGEPFVNGDYDVTFYVDNSPYAVVNAGTPFSTIASIMKVIEDFCEKVRPKALVWISTKTSKDDKQSPGQRDLLYKRFLSRQVPEGYKFIEGGWGGGVLERINQDEPKYVWPGASQYLAPPKEKLKDPFADFDFNDPSIIQEKESLTFRTISFPDLRWKAVEFFSQLMRNNAWKFYNENGYAVGALYHDGILEYSSQGPSGIFNISKSGFADLEKAARYIFINTQQPSEEIGESTSKAEGKLSEKDSEIIANFPDLDGMYVKVMYKSTDSAAYSFFFPGYEQKNKRLGMLFYPEMELRFSDKKQEESGYGWQTVPVKHLVLKNKQPDFLNVARYLYLMTQSIQ